MKGWVLPDTGSVDPSEIIILINDQQVSSGFPANIKFNKELDSLQTHFSLDLSKCSFKSGDKIQLAFKDTGKKLREKILCFKTQKNQPIIIKRCISLFIFPKQQEPLLEKH